jgi:hypothetical protein
MRAGIFIMIIRPDRRRLAMTEDRNSTQRHVWRAAIVLPNADGVGAQRDHAPDRHVQVCVWRWQQRFVEEGVDASCVIKRLSRIPELGPEVAERVVALTLAARRPRRPTGPT